MTAVDRLKADPFAFYAQRDPAGCARSTRSMPTILPRWKGEAVHKVFEDGCSTTIATRTSCAPRAERLLADEAIHPMLRALWAPRLLEAIDWIAELERDEPGRGPAAAQGRDQGRSDARRRDRPRPRRPDRPAGRRRPRDHRLQDRQAAVAEGGRRGLCAAARPARADRPRRRVRGRRAATRKRSNIGRCTRYRGSFGTADAPGQGHAAGRVPRPCRPQFRRGRGATG